jgi:hypothetical protein
MSSLRSTIILCAGLVAETVPAQAGSLTDLVTNGSFTSYTNSSGQANTSEGFQPGYNGTITGWSNNSNGGGTGYNFLFLQSTNGTAAADNGAYGNSGYLGLWDSKTNSATNTWDGNGPGGSGNFIAMDGDYNTGAITQTLTGLTKGTVYAITFEYAFGQQNSYTGPTVQDLLVSLGSHSQAVPQYSLPSKGFSGWMSETFYLQADGTSDVLSFLAIGNVQLPPFALISDISAYYAPEPASTAVLVMGLAGVTVAARRRRAARQV